LLNTSFSVSKLFGSLLLSFCASIYCVWIHHRFVLHQTSSSEKNSLQRNQKPLQLWKYSFTTKWLIESDVDKYVQDVTFTLCPQTLNSKIVDGKQCWLLCNWCAIYILYAVMFKNYAYVFLVLIVHTLVHSYIVDE
jgi:hypothetical protein